MASVSPVAAISPSVSGFGALAVRLGRSGDVVAKLV